MEKNKQIKLSTLEEEVLLEIPEGHENAISRKDLVDKVGLADRVVRRAIEKARGKGYIICNFQDGKGYFKPKNIEEINTQFLINRARAMSILVQQKYLYRELKAEGYDVSWKEDEYNDIQ